MNSFKDFVSEDNKVFFNAEEFGEEHFVGGEKCLIVMCNENKTKADGKFDHNDTNIQSFGFLVQKSQLGFRPLVDTLIEFDEDSYLVESVVDKFDSYQVFLKANRG